MAVKHTAAERGARRGRDHLDTLLREAEGARIASGLSYASLGRAVHLSASQVARILQRDVPEVAFVRVAELLGAVGLELSARAFPEGPPVRDAGSLALLTRFRARLAPVVVSRPEVPVVDLGMAGRVDLRAWDLGLDGPGWTARLDAETRLGDAQAILRRTALKQRDSKIDCVILLLSDTPHNRAAVRAAADALREMFPVSQRTALRRLGRGESPGGNTLILV
jgi:hypothetical protein